MKRYFAGCGFRFVADFAQLPLIHTLHVARDPIPEFLANGILSVRAGGLLHFWDLAAAPLPNEILPHDSLAGAIGFDASGKLLAVGGVIGQCHR